MPAIGYPNKAFYANDGTAGNDNPPAISQFYEAAAQSFVPGDVLTIASGQVSQTIATGSNLTSATGTLAGRAVNPAQATTNAATPVRVFLPGDKYRAQVYHSTPASALVAINLIGASYQLRNDATGGWMVDISATTNPVVKVQGIIDAVGTQYGIVEFTFIQSAVLN